MKTSGSDWHLRFSKLVQTASGGRVSLVPLSRLVRPMDTDKFEGRFGSRTGAGGGASAPAPLSRRLAQRAPITRHAKVTRRSEVVSDLRQRATVKVHYFDHARGGASALKAHTRYLAREAASQDDLTQCAETPAPEIETPEAGARAHASYLARGGPSESVFYDRDAEAIDGGTRAEAWARSDKRHFRIILAPEEGEKLRDLTGYTREVMARAEAELGTRFSWVAVNHHDTGHAHTHIILRGRRANGQDLILPRDFIRHRMREIARDVATDWLGRRTPQQEREALDREVTRHGPTRLDRMLEARMSEKRTIQLGRLQGPGNDPHLTTALRARARELHRLGLASEVRRGVLQFEPGWQDRLKEMQLHLDIRKQLMAQRQIAQQAERERLACRSSRCAVER